MGARGAIAPPPPPPIIFILVNVYLDIYIHQVIILHIGIA